MRSISILVALALSSFSLEGDVTRLLEPLDLSSLRPAQSGETRSGFVAPVPVVPKSFSAPSHAIVTLDALSLEKRLSDALTNRYQAAGKVAVRLSREWKPLELPSGFEVRVLQATPDELSTNTFLRFAIIANGVKVGDWAYPLSCNQMVDVAFSKSYLNRGSRLTPESLTFRTVDVLRQGGNCVRSDARLNGYQLGVNLKPDSMLKWSQLSKVVLVRKGQVVNVFASGKGIYVEMKGQSLEDGVEGSFVRVKNLSSKREFQAKVLNENSVKVYF